MTQHTAQPPLFKPLGVRRLFWARCLPKGGRTPAASQIDLADALVAAGLVDLLVNASASDALPTRDDATVAGRILWHDGEDAVVSEVSYTPRAGGEPGGQLVGLPPRLMAQCPPANEGWAVLLLLQDDDGVILAFFRSEDEVRQAFGDPPAGLPHRYRSPVRDIRACIEDERAQTGFVDYLTGSQGCSSVLTDCRDRSAQAE